MLECPSCARSVLRRTGDGHWACPSCNEEFDPISGLPNRGRYRPSPHWDTLARRIDEKGLQRTTCPDCGAPASLEEVEVAGEGGRRRKTLRRCWRKRSPYRAACRPVVVSEEDLGEDTA